MTFKLDNVIWRFDYNTEDTLGEAYIGIPRKIFKKFIKECGDDGIPPYYEENDMRDFNKHEDHNCANPNAQIILMNWLGRREKSYVLPYTAQDPFWLFHDYMHSRKDVYGSIVDGVDLHVEKDRLLQGAELALKHGVNIKVDTLKDILHEYEIRNKVYKVHGIHQCDIHYDEFSTFIRDDEKELFEFLANS